MPFKPGQSGNPDGTRREKKFAAALERAIAQDDGKRLREAAESLLSNAAAGEPWAIQQLADRLDGKPTQQVDMEVRRGTRELSDADLSDIAAGSSDRASEPAPSQEVSSKLH